MVWPFTSTAPKGETAKKDGNEGLSSLLSSSSGPSPTDKQWVLETVKEWGYIASAGVVGLGAMHVYVNYFRRIPSASYIRPSFFRKRSLFGRVTRVGDGDNFHLFHTPGGRFVGWGWLRKVPENRKQLKERTIPVRLAGIDAPEGAHFGRPAQPFAAEALKWLSDYILHRNVRAYVYKRDQYNRAVATVYVRRFLIRRNVGLEMVKRGLATVYEAKSGAEFGGIKGVYEKAEAKAKKKKKGMWSGKASDFESPREYKSRYGSPSGDDK